MFLSIFSLIVYIGVAYILSKQYGLLIALLANGILGIYDGTIGFWLALKLKANIEDENVRSQNFPGIKTALIMFCIACVFAFVGFGLTRL
ncbi:MAG: hypothetical protein QM768_02645 [Agriterribacter sp.]